MSNPDPKSQPPVAGNAAAGQSFNVNNFDLIRLFAAGQVALYHGISHLTTGNDGGALGTILGCIPGVPIFFFVSGFLVSKSFEVSGSLRQYARNRILRLYPGLTLCVLVSIAIVVALGYLGTVSFRAGEMLAWLAAQLTVVQFYNPEFLRGFGTGVLNGSLWTISVEVQFYVLVPVLYWVMHRLRERSRNAVLLASIGIFAVCNRVYFSLAPEHSAELLYKLVKVSFVPWFYMFLVGVLVQRNLPAVLRVVENRFASFLAAYILAMGVLVRGFDTPLGNAIAPGSYILLVAVVLAAAFSRRNLAEVVLRRNDISYGLYIWHMPIVNSFLYLGWSGTNGSVLAVLFIAVLTAAVSWFVVERPALRLKRRALHAH